MREIKFRAWDKENKKMIYFDFNNIYGYEGEICGVILPDEQTALTYNTGYGYDEEGINKKLELMQHIGLKDKNGKEIYEGDIIKINYRRCFKLGQPVYEKFIAKVIYSSSYASFIITNCKPDNIKHECENLGDYKDFEVIGNIYDNPEILEEN